MADAPQEREHRSAVDQSRERHAMSAHQVPVITFELPPVAASVAEARHRVVAFAQEHSASRELHERVAIAVTEAFRNAVLHAYDDGEAERDSVCVSADVDDGSLECVVVDRGHGIRGGAESKGLGAGMQIMNQCADAFAVRERTPGTEVWLRFQL